MTEFTLIEHLKKRNQIKRADVLQGIGDDCARVEVPTDNELAITSDTLCEGVHFPKGTSAHAIGFKALAVSLSDLAAMGAEPTWATLALTLPDNDEGWLADFAEGFFTLAEKHNVQLIGGDTTQGPLSITVQAHGLIPKGQAITRSGAQPGDYICVTGVLGQAGLELLEATSTVHGKAPYNRLNYPEPRLEAGRALRDIASAAIDVSDGLIADLGHILECSGVGARVTLEELPLSVTMRQDQDPAKMLELALTAGDDYEICFTIAEDKIEAVNQLQKELQLPMKHIGNIESTKGLRIHRKEGVPLEISSGGYEHFSEKNNVRSK